MPSGLDYAKGLYHLASAASLVHWVWAILSGGAGGLVVGALAVVANAPMTVVLLLGGAAFCGLGLLVLAWRERRGVRSSSELAADWQQACDDLTNQLHIHGCGRPWERPEGAEPPSGEIAREMRDEYQRNHRDRLLRLHDESRRRVAYLGGNRFRPRLHSPQTPDEMWLLVRDIAGHVIWVLDPSMRVERGGTNLGPHDR